MAVGLKTFGNLLLANVHYMGTSGVKYASRGRIYQIRRCAGHGLQLGLLQLYIGHGCEQSQV